MKDHMQYFIENQEISEFSKYNAKISEVQSVMTESYEKVNKIKSQPKYEVPTPSIFFSEWCLWLVITGN